jgi:hypothetical protein
MGQPVGLCRRMPSPAQGSHGFAPLSTPSPHTNATPPRPHTHTLLRLALPPPTFNPHPTCRCGLWKVTSRSATSSGALAANCRASTSSSTSAILERASASAVSSCATRPRAAAAASDGDPVSSPSPLLAKRLRDRGESWPRPGLSGSGRVPRRQQPGPESPGPLIRDSMREAWWEEQARKERSARMGPISEQWRCGF